MGRRAYVFLFEMTTTMMKSQRRKIKPPRCIGRFHASYCMKVASSFLYSSIHDRRFWSANPSTRITYPQYSRSRLYTGISQSGKDRHKRAYDHIAEASG